MNFKNIKCPTIPIVRKCCFCVPIRKGVTIFGYVNLILSLLSVPLLIFMLIEEITTTPDDKTIYHTNQTDFTDKPSGEDQNSPVNLRLALVFVVIDVVMTIVLLVGSHKKNRLLLKIYFCFGVVYQIVTLCVDLRYFDFREYFENTFYFIFLGLNIYLLFLVYNTLHIIDETSEVQYVVHQDP